MFLGLGLSRLEAGMVRRSPGECQLKWSLSFCSSSELESVDGRQTGKTQKCSPKLVPNGVVSYFTSLPAAPTAVKEMVGGFLV